MKYEDKPLFNNQRDPTRLKTTVRVLLGRSAYGKLQTMLKEGLLTPQTFRELRIFDDDYCSEFRLDVEWLFEHIYPTTQERDHKFVTFLVCHQGVDPHKTHELVVLTQALGCGLSFEEITLYVWIGIIRRREDNNKKEIIIKHLLELGVTIPRDQPLDDEHPSTHSYILKKIFRKPSLFKMVTERLPGVTLGHYLKSYSVMRGLREYHSELNLEFLFSVGFTPDDLCDSPLFDSIVTHGSGLINDWISRDLGPPRENYVDSNGTLMIGLASRLSGRYYRKVVSYLMEHKDTDNIEHKCIYISTTLIKYSIRINYMSRDDWEHVIQFDDINSDISDNIRRALSSIKFAKKPRPELV
jgi:hypothetical protein